MLIRGMYGVVYSTIIIGMFRYIIIILYEVPTTLTGRHLSPRYGQVILVSGYPVLTAVS